MAASSVGRACHNIKNINAYKSCVIRQFCNNVAVAESANTIKIPKKKSRDELSILRALASTVELDYSYTSSYSLIDDPKILPNYDLQQKEYLLSISSGRDAAKYVMENYAEFFQNRPMEDFTYTPEVYKPLLDLKEPEDSINGLIERIQRRKPLLAYESYQKVKDKGEDVPAEVQQELLELLCFRNSEDSKQESAVEDLHCFPIKKDFTSKSLWKSDGPAETVFENIADPGEMAYNCLLKGRAKYKNVKGAWKLYKEMKSKEIRVSLESYNLLILRMIHMDSTGEKVMKSIMELLQDMKGNQVAPDISTFNNILYCLSDKKLQRYENRKSDVIKVLSEMRHCGIEPQLVTWYRVLDIFYIKTNKNRELLSEILDCLEGTELEPKDPYDYMFFDLAMQICLRLHDIELAYKVDTLLHHGNNMMLLRQIDTGVTYHENFFQLICLLEDMNKVIQHYEKLVKSPITDTTNILQYTLRAVERNEAYYYIPQIWPNTKRKGSYIINVLLSLMAQCKHSPALQETFVELIDNLLPPNEYPVTYTNKFKLQGPSSGHCITICCHANNYEKAKQFFNNYLKNVHSSNSTNLPRQESLKSLISLCIKHKDTQTAMSICMMMSVASYSSLEDVVFMVKKKMKLSEDQIFKLDNLF